jgi:hypothetical protein
MDALRMADFPQYFNDPEYMRRARERISSRLRPASNGCIECLYRGSRGYSAILFGGHMWRAHRLVWAMERGDIEEGLVLDHLCRNRRCVNLDHLQPVTAVENFFRSPFVTPRDATAENHKTHCVNGHLYTDRDWLRRAKKTSRRCMTCFYADKRLRRQRNRKRNK